ncbi:FUSC family protein [Paraburkholderia sp. RL18-101-BIB-B]|uniref:FUSC family protein n=1 Tax=Paraburkholderia sp. RL18-101-BIB-B TaxID=3031634 RepID=UPI0038B7F4C9
MIGFALIVQPKGLIAGPKGAIMSRRAGGQRIGPAHKHRGLRQFLRDLWNEAIAGSHFGRYSARLALGTMIAIAISTHLPIKQGYWLVLTSLFVVQPNFAQTLEVSMLRVGGTILGATLPSVLGFAFHSPLLLALTILPLPAGSLAARAGGYVSYILFLMPHFILVAQLGLPTGSPWELAIWRNVNSTAGAALGIVITLILWPGWEKYSLASSASNAIACTAACLSNHTEKLVG